MEQHKIWKLHSIISLFILLIMTGCVPPLNISTESARMLQKKEIEAQANVSYYTDTWVWFPNPMAGAKVGYGVSDKYNVKLRSDVLLRRKELRTYYLELDQKFSLADYLAISVPLGMNISNFGDVIGITEEEGVITRDIGVYARPRVFVSLFMNDKMDLTFVPKLMVSGVFNRDEDNLGQKTNSSMDVKVNPALSVGLGYLSTNRRFESRVELGTDFVYLAGGLSFTYRFNLQPKHIH